VAIPERSGNTPKEEAILPPVTHHQKQSFDNEKEELMKECGFKFLG